MPHADRITGGLVIAFGGFLFVISRSIEGFGDDPVGPRFLPQAATLGLVLLGALLVANPGVRHARTDLTDIATEAKSQGLPPVILALVGIVYVGLFHVVGYLLATALVLPSVLVVFGHRRPVRILVLSLLVTAAFYGVFFVLLGAHDPPGAWLDLRGLLD